MRERSDHQAVEPAARPSRDDPVRTLADAAAGTVFFERMRLFHGRSIISLGETLAHHPGGRMFNAVGATVTVRSHTVKDAVLDADTLMLFQDRQAFSETAYFESATAIQQLPEAAVLTEVPHDADCILGYNNAHAGYQHWLTQCIPAIDWSLRQQRTRDAVLILPRLDRWQEDFLGLLGHDRVPRLTPSAGVKYRLPHVEYSEFLNGTTSFTVCLSMLDTVQRIAAAVPSFRSDDKVLYVKDADPYYGSIGNEEAVIALLRAYGVTVVEPGALPTAERINLFRNADVVIGALGQGLSDVLFCRPGALLWEWMPRHHQNATFNRLAQAAQVDYWGDLFEPADPPARPGLWNIDLGLVRRRLTELSVRSAGLTASGPRVRPHVPAATLASRPIDELVTDFDSLGDNCEFGLVQRRAGAEPLGLLRFNGFYVPPEFRLEKLVAALQRKFDGLAAAGTITVFADGIPGQRELIVRDSVYEFWYHTGIAEGEVDLAVQTEREMVRLGFLRRKLLEDLSSGDKTWVWKSQATTERQQVQPLLDVLRGLGPNTLLWVVEADSQHPAGTIEPLEPDFVKGYVSRFAPYEAVADIDVASWLVVCWRADTVLRPKPTEAVSEPPAAPASAMEFLARNAAVTPVSTPASQSETGRVSGIMARLRRR